MDFTSSSLPLWALELCLDLVENKSNMTKVVAVGIDNEVAITLAMALSINTTVTEIDIDLSNLESDGLEALGEMFSTNTTIETVRLQTCLSPDGTNCPCTQRSRGHHGHHVTHRLNMSAISRGLGNNSTIQTVIMERCVPSLPGTRRREEDARHKLMVPAKKQKVLASMTKVIAPTRSPSPTLVSALHACAPEMVPTASPLAPYVPTAWF